MKKEFFKEEDIPKKGIEKSYINDVAKVSFNKKKDAVGPNVTQSVFNVDFELNLRLKQLAYSLEKDASSLINEAIHDLLKKYNS